MKNFCSVLFFLGLSLAISAHADGINTQSFNPSVSDHYVLTEDGFNTPWPLHSRFYLGANYNYISDPLVALSQGTNIRRFSIINSIQTYDLMAGFKVTDALGLFIGLPIHQIDFSNNPGTTYPTGSYTKMGDVKLMAKLRLTPADSSASIALVPEAHIGIGNDGYFTSDSSSYWAMRLVIEQTINDRFQVAGNIGFAYAQNAIYSDQNTATTIDNRNRIPMAIGSFLKFTDVWGANLEYSNTLSIPTNQNQSSNDLYLGARCAAKENLVLTLGGSAGNLTNSNNQNYRVIAGIRFAPFDQKPTPTPSPATPEPTPAEILPIATPWPSATPVAVAPVAQEKLVISLDVSSVPFDFDTAKLPKFYGDRIREIGRFLGTHKALWRELTVEGHTDERGSNAYNDKLSKARAFAVRQLLLEGGAPNSKIKSVGFGKRKPLDPHHREKAWTKNRRVDLDFKGVKDVVLIKEGVGKGV